MKTVRANGLDFAYLEEGSGRLALCLHGFPDHPLTFLSLMRALASAGYRAVAPWMRGYAPTSIPSDGRYGTVDLGADAVAIADALAPGEEAVLIGHDWGAAAAYAAGSSGRFSKIVTLAVPHTAGLAAGFLEPAQLKRSWYMFFNQSTLAESVIPLNDFAIIDQLWADWSPGFTVDPSYMRTLKQTLAQPGTLSASLGYYRALFDPSTPAPTPIPVPGLHLQGADDGCIGLDAITIDHMRPFFPSGLTYEVIDNAGHFLHLERPELIESRIIDFLRT